MNIKFTSTNNSSINTSSNSANIKIIIGFSSRIIVKSS
nr:MAG TPA: hypothetical protein [Crassvirales sp.]